MKITKKAGKLIVTATAEELKKNPKLLAAIKKAQAGMPAPDSSTPVDPSSGGGLELPSGGDDLGGAPTSPDGVSDDLGGLDAPEDGSVDPELAGDPTEKFTSAVDKAYQDAFGKPIDEGMKQVLKGLAQMAQGDKSPAVDDLDGTDGQIPGGDTDPLGGDSPVGGAGGDPAASGPGAGGDAAAGGAGAGGDPLSPLAQSRGRLTRVASASDFVNKLAAHLAK